MTNTSPSLQAVASALCAARRSQTLADATALANALVAEAEGYAVQKRVGAELNLWADAVPRHWKSGGPSRELPITHAPLPDAVVWQTPAAVGAQPFQHRIIEAEIALRLGRDVTAEDAQAMTHASADAFIDAMTVAIEVVDTRWQQPLADVPGLLKLADLQVHGALVLDGAWKPYVRRDWLQQRCSLITGKQPPVVRQGTHTLADPAWVLPQWLRHVTREFGTVPASTIVTTGNWVGHQTANKDDLVVVEFEDLGKVSLQF